MVGGFGRLGNGRGMRRIIREGNERGGEGVFWMSLVLVVVLGRGRGRLKELVLILKNSLLSSSRAMEIERGEMMLLLAMMLRVEAVIRTFKGKLGHWLCLPVDISGTRTVLR